MRFALDMPLGQLIDALARYRRGYLGACLPYHHPPSHTRTRCGTTRELTHAMAARAAQQMATGQATGQATGGYRLWLPA